jgi:hypothetical protein
MKDRIAHFFSTQPEATECFVAGEFIFFKEHDAAAHDKNVKRYTRDNFEVELDEPVVADEGEEEEEEEKSLTDGTSENGTVELKVLDEPVSKESESKSSTIDKEEVPANEVAVTEETKEENTTNDVVEEKKNSKKSTKGK